MLKKRCDKKFEQIEGRAPLNERMRMNRDRKDYNITFLLYGSHSGQGRIAFKDNQGESHSLLLISQPLQLTLKDVRDEDKLSETLVRKYVAIDKFDLWVKDLQRRLKLKKGDSEKITKKEFDELNTREAWREETGTTEEQRKRRKSKTTDRRFDLIHDTELFNKLLNRLVLKNKELVQQYPNLEDYTTAIKITDISDVTNRGGGDDETKRKLKDGDEKSLYHYSIWTDLNVDAEYFVNAIENEEHTEGECWINTMIDHYKDTLMSSNKWESKRMTRDKILKLMNLTEEEFRTNGASVEDMEPVFKEFKLTVRLYNYLGQKIYSYDPELKNKNIPALFGLIKGNHIYTMNDNIMSVSRRNIEEDMKIVASTDFKLNSKDKPVKYDFFNDIDDVMKIVKDNEEEGEVNLVSRKDLNCIYCQFKRAKYEPKITMGAGGAVSSLKLKFNKLTINIRSQSLIECAVDTCVNSNDADMFNAVNQAFFDFKKGLCNPNHKSYHDNDDLNIFSIAHTIAPSGYLKTIGGYENKYVELDRRKAYTKSTIDTVEIPFFFRNLTFGKSIAMSTMILTR